MIELEWDSNRNGDLQAETEHDGFKVVLTLKQDEYAGACDALDCIGSLDWESLTDNEREYRETTGNERRNEGRYLIDTDHGRGSFLTLSEPEVKRVKSYQAMAYTFADALAQARKEIEQDLTRVRGYLRGDWCVCNLWARAYRNDIELGSACLGGLESDGGEDYLTECAEDLIEEAINEAKAQLESLCAAV